MNEIQAILRPIDNELEREWDWGYVCLSSFIKHKQQQKWEWEVTAI